MTTLDAAMLCCGVIAVGGGALAAASRVLLHAVSMAVISALGLAGCLALLGADAVAGLYLLAAVLGAAVLLLASLSVTRAPLERHDDFDVSWARRAGAAAVGVAAAGLLGIALVESVGWHAATLSPGGAGGLARALLGTWWWALLLAALTAVVALLAALRLARPDGEGR